MTNKAEQQTTYFYVKKNSRPNNPTFVSYLMNDSLSLYTPQKSEKVESVKPATEYTAHFEPLSDKLNIYNPPSSFNYGKVSQQAFEKNRSYLSKYGSNLVSPTNFEKKTSS